MSKYIQLIDVRYNNGEELKALQRIDEVEAYIDRNLKIPIINNEWANYVKNPGKINKTVEYITDGENKNYVGEIQETNTYDLANNILTKKTKSNETGGLSERITDNKTVSEVRGHTETMADLVSHYHNFFDSQVVGAVSNERVYRRFQQNIAAFSIELRGPNLAIPSLPVYTWTITSFLDHSMSRLNIQCIIAPNTMYRPLVKVSSQNTYLIDSSKTEISFSFDFFNETLLSGSRDNRESYFFGSVIVFNLSNGSQVKSEKIVDYDYNDIEVDFDLGYLNSSFSPIFKHTIPVGAVSFNYFFFVETYDNLFDLNSFNFFFSNIRCFYSLYSWDMLKAVAIEGYNDNLNPSLTITNAINDGAISGDNILRTFVL